MKTLNGTYLHQQGLKEITAKQAARRIRQEAAKKKAKTELGVSGAARVKADPGAADVAMMEAESGAADVASTLAPKSEVIFKWTVQPCFVKCSMEGVPFQLTVNCDVAHPGMTVPPPEFERPSTKRLANQMASGESGALVAHDELNGVQLHKDTSNVVDASGQASASHLERDPFNARQVA